MMATKKRTMPYHIMPDGTMMPGATHEAYMAKETKAKKKPVKKKPRKKAAGKKKPLMK